MFVPVVLAYALVNVASYTAAFLPSDGKLMYICLVCTHPSVAQHVTASNGACRSRCARRGSELVLSRAEQLFFLAAYLEILLLPLMVLKFFQG